jgi:hypothetical protein
MNKQGSSLRTSPLVHKSTRVLVRCHLSRAQRFHSKGSPPELDPFAQNGSVRCMLLTFPDETGIEAVPLLVFCKVSFTRVELKCNAKGFDVILATPGRHREKD